MMESNLLLEQYGKFKKAELEVSQNCHKVGIPALFKASLT